MAQLRHGMTWSVMLPPKKWKRYVVLCCPFLLLIVFIIHMTTDDCHQKYHTELLCKEVNQGTIAGGMCHELCVEKSLRLHSCSRDGHGNLIFTINNTAVVKMPDRYHPGVTSFHGVYLQPEEGTSMDQFRARINEYLIEMLGENDHRQRLNALMETADVNKDDKVSLAEAKTLWSLLKQNEFLVMQVFQNSFHVPRLSQFCGEAYMISDLPEPGYRQLYDLRGLLNKFMFYGLFSWHHLSWVERGKIGVGLLEFTLDIYHHHNDGSFYLCGTNETNIGFTRRHDFLMQDLTDVLPRRLLEYHLDGVRCVRNDQCRYTEHCTTICDVTNSKCTGHLVRPNLSLVCDILKPYLLPDMPKTIRPDFLNLMARCQKLQTLAADFEIQHSLIINDLRSLLWHHIRSVV